MIRRKQIILCSNCQERFNPDDSEVTTYGGVGRDYPEGVVWSGGIIGNACCNERTASPKLTISLLLAK